MANLQREFNRSDYYSIREASQVLRVTDKTIRNRIDREEIKTYCFELGKGKRQWLIPKMDIESLAGIKDVPVISHDNIPSFAEEIIARLTEENKSLLHELVEIKSAQNDLATNCEKIWSTLEYISRSAESKDLRQNQN